MFKFTRSLRFVAPLIGVVALGLGSMAFSPSAHADDWCWNDPVVSVNGHQAAINVGIEGDAASIAARGQLALITVSVPVGSTDKILSVQHGSFLEGVVFLPTTDASKYGNVNVTFFSLHSRATVGTGMQITQDGQTVTTYGSTAQGVTGHISVQ